MTPLIITQGHRQAVVDGNSVQLFVLQNKRKPKSVWPKTECAGPAKAQVAGFLWAVSAVMDFGEQEPQQH